MKKHLLLTILFISCSFQISANTEVCIDPLANNYFPMADPTNVLYNSEVTANVTVNNDVCVYNEGCTYNDATNYNADATYDDGTCVFDEPYIYVTNPINGEIYSNTNINITYEVQNVDIGMPSEFPEGGHIRYAIDGGTNASTFDSPSIITQEFTNGIHTIHFILYNNVSGNIMPWTPSIETIITFTVASSGCLDSDSEIIGYIDEENCYPVIEGCMDSTAYNYTPPIGDIYNDINTNIDEMCIPFIDGCLDSQAYNYNDYNGDGEPDQYTGNTSIDVNTDDGSCIEIIYGCVDNDYVEYDETVNTDDGSCQVLLIDEYIELTEANINLSSALNAWSLTIDLQEGWNMIGYGCPEPLDVTEALTAITGIILIIKNNNGAIYMPEYNFNGIGDFIPGFGYQIKVSQSREDFNICDWYDNDVDEEIEIGDYVHGGIVFWLSPSGHHGLVVAPIDVNTQYQYGCYGTPIEGGSVNTGIGGGALNTNIILNQNCDNLSFTSAANAANDFQYNGYSDWYLPTLLELATIYVTVGPGSYLGNLANLESDWYWSSVYWNDYDAWGFHGGYGLTDRYTRLEYEHVRPVRSF